MGSSQNGNWITQWVTWSLSWQLSFRLNLYNAFKPSWKFLANTLHTYRDRPPPSFFHVFLRTLPFFTPSIWLSIRQTLMLVPKVSVLKRLDCKHLNPAISREKSKPPTFTIPLPVTSLTLSSKARGQKLPIHQRKLFDMEDCEWLEKGLFKSGVKPTF